MMEQRTILPYVSPLPTSQLKTAYLFMGISPRGDFTGDVERGSSYLGDLGSRSDITYTI